MFVSGMLPLIILANDSLARIHGNVVQQPVLKRCQSVSSQFGCLFVCLSAAGQLSVVLIAIVVLATASSKMLPGKCLLHDASTWFS